jgi:hypothetical protein
MHTLQHYANIMRVCTQRVCVHGADGRAVGRGGVSRRGWLTQPDRTYAFNTSSRVRGAAGEGRRRADASRTISSSMDTSVATHCIKTTRGGYLQYARAPGAGLGQGRMSAENKHGPNSSPGTLRSRKTLDKANAAPTLTRVLAAVLGNGLVLLGLVGIGVPAHSGPANAPTQTRTQTQTLQRDFSCSLCLRVTRGGTLVPSHQLRASVPGHASRFHFAMWCILTKLGWGAGVGGANSAAGCEEDRLTFPQRLTPDAFWGKRKAQLFRLR